MSLQTTLDLDNWPLSDLFGTLMSQEAQICKTKTQIRGPLALIGRGSQDQFNKEKREGKKKKKGLD